MTSASTQEITTAPQLPSKKSWRRRVVWIALALVLIAVAYLLLRPQVHVVNATHPQPTVITETVTSTGRVHGVTETLVGAQTTGVVRQLFVDQGDTVTKNQKLAVLDNTVALAQVGQAQQAVATARAQLNQVRAGSRTSDIQAAEQQVEQARAVVVQQQAASAQALQAVAQLRESTTWARAVVVLT